MRRGWRLMSLIVGTVASATPVLVIASVHWSRPRHRAGVPSDLDQVDSAADVSDQKRLVRDSVAHHVHDARQRQIASLSDLLRQRAPFGAPSADSPAEAPRAAAADAATPTATWLRPRYSADEAHVIEDIRERALADIRAKLVPLYAKLKDAKSPAETSSGAMISQLLDASGIDDMKTFMRLVTAVNAGTAEQLESDDRAQLLSLLREAGRATSQEFREAVPPERWADLKAQGAAGPGLRFERKDNHWQFVNP